MTQNGNGTDAEPPVGKPSAQSAGRMRLAGVAVAGVAIAAFGLALVASAPFDGPARSGLGASLLTGVLVGGALIGIEYALDQRRAAREEAARQELFRGLAEVANDSLAALVSAHFKSAWRWFGSLAPEEIPGEPVGSDGLSPDARPSGWTWPQDARDLRMAIQWRLEVMTDDRSWWRSERDLAATDAIFFAVTDVAEQLGLELDESDDARLNAAGTATVRRLTGIAQLLGEAGDPLGAWRIDAQVNSLTFGETDSYAPSLPRWESDSDVHFIMIGSSPLQTLRKELAWITAELRASKVRVDEYGSSFDLSGPSPEEYRWKPLLGPSESADGMWDRRYTSGSWLRRLIVEAAEGLPRTRLGRLANPSDPAST